MSKLDPNSFLYLNRDNRWPDFTLSRLELGDDGGIKLASLPRLNGPPQAVEVVDDSPVGAIAVGDDGTLWFTGSKRGLMRIDACDGSIKPVQCLEGGGIRVGDIAYNSVRRTLLVIDAATDRIIMFDAVSLQTLDVWSGDGTQRFSDLRFIAVDFEGSFYAVDFGNRRVVKFDFRGEPVASFAETVESQLEDQQKWLKLPGEIATNRGRPGIYILDQESKSVFAFDSEGHYRFDFPLQLDAPSGLAVNDDSIFVGDAARKRIFRYKHDGTLVGEAQSFQGSVAGLALDLHGNLIVHTGGDPALVKLEIAGACAKRGWMWGGPFQNPSPRLEQWNRLRALIGSIPDGAHLQIFIFASDKNIPPDASNSTLPPWEGNSIDLSEALKQQLANRKPLKRWIRLPLDIAEALVLGSRLELVWIGLEFTSEGLASPSLTQIRIDFDHETYIEHLPSIYREDQESAAFLTRWLTLFESLFVEVEAEIRALPELFDPFAVRSEFLQWLAGWLALAELDGEWPDQRKREVLANAFDLYARRGTVEGLRDSLRFFAGIEAHVEEPLLQAGWWALPADDDPSIENTQMSVLGFSTALVAAEAQGAVVGTTAILDHSHLIGQEEFGAPLFDDLAHRFSLQIYRGGSFSEQTIQMLQALVEREKPAHTDYHVCVIEPNLRLGFQSRIGIDTVVAGPNQPRLLTEGASGLLLGGQPAGAIGGRSTIGQNTVLGLRQFEG